MVTTQKKLFTLSLLIALSISVIVVCFPVSGTVHTLYYESSSSSFLEINGVGNYDGLGFEFTGNGEYLHSVTAKLKRSDETVGVIGAVLWKVEGGTYEEYSTSLFDVSDISNVTGSDFTFQFSSTVELETGHAYTVGLYMNETFDGTVYVYGGGTTGYYYLATVGGSWTNNNGIGLYGYILSDDAYGGASYPDTDTFKLFVVGGGFPFETELDNYTIGTNDGFGLDVTYGFHGVVYELGVPTGDGVYNITWTNASASLTGAVNGAYTDYDDGSFTGGIFPFDLGFDSDQFGTNQNWYVGLNVTWTIGAVTNTEKYILLFYGEGTWIFPTGTPVVSPTATPYGWTETDQIIDDFVAFMVPLIVMLIPSALMGYVFKMGKWGYIIGLMIGSGLGWVFVANFPPWLMFLVVIGIVGFGYDSFRKRGD